MKIIIDSWDVDEQDWEAILDSIRWYRGLENYTDSSRTLYSSRAARATQSWDGRRQLVVSLQTTKTRTIKAIAYYSSGGE